MDPATITLFRAVATRSAEERAEYYTQHQVSEQVRGEIESLLQAGDRTVDSFAGHVASAALKAMLEDPLPPPHPALSRPLLQSVSIGRYEVKRLLGRGGMSDVYLARDPMLERDIAVKLIGGELDSEVGRRRLVREASAAGRLRHPNIVTIFDAGEHDGRPYIAMEYVPGETLRSLIRRRPSLPLRRRLELIEGACAGLAHAHRVGVVHLDIKPDNLIVDETGVVKVLDFGIARVLSSEAVATRHIVGTLRYMSPEQIAGDPLDHRSDIFSLGCSLYELLAYLPAYSGSTREIVYRIAVGPVPRLAEVAPDTDPRLDAAIARAMALEPGERFADLDEFRNELARLREDLDPAGDRPVQIPDETTIENSHTFAVPSTARTAPPSSLQPPTIEKPRWRGAAIGAAAVAVALVWVIALLALWNREPVTSQPQVASVPASGGAPPPPTVVSVPAPAPGSGADAPAADAGPDANEVWRLLNFGDRAGVLKLLTTTPAATGRLPYDVLSAVRQSMAQSRQAASATPGASSSAPYRLAEERLTRANRLEAGREPVKALVELWAASDSYNEAVTSVRANVPPSVTASRDPAPGIRDLEIEARAPSPESGKAQLPPPSPLPGPAVQPTAEPTPRIPAPAPGPVPTTAVERAPTEAPVRVPSAADAVLEAIDRYRSAFRARDISQLLKVYPSLSRDEAEQVRRTFDLVNAYEVEIRDPRVQVQGDVASVAAVIARRMTPRVGGRAESYETPSEFRLRRTGSTWEITDVIKR